MPGMPSQLPSALPLNFCTPSPQGTKPWRVPLSAGHWGGGQLSRRGKAHRRVVSCPGTFSGLGNFQQRRIHRRHFRTAAACCNCTARRVANSFYRRWSVGIPVAIRLVVLEPGTSSAHRQRSSESPSFAGTVGLPAQESLDRLWGYRYEGSMVRYLKNWIDQLRWQGLKPMEKLADVLLSHLEGILNYCRTKVPLGAGRSDQWQHQSPFATRAQLPQPQLPAPENATAGRHRNPTRRFSESRVKR